MYYRKTHICDYKMHVRCTQTHSCLESGEHHHHTRIWHQMPLIMWKTPGLTFFNLFMATAHGKGVRIQNILLRNSMGAHGVNHPFA